MDTLGTSVASENLLSIGDVAALLGLEPSTVRYYDRALAPVRVGTRRIYDRAIVLQFAAARAERRARIAAMRTR